MTLVAQRFLFVLPAWVVASALLIAQAEQRPPVFRSRAEIYEIAVTVLDRNRVPIEGLTADQFTLTEGGRPLRISQFSQVTLPAAKDPPSQVVEVPSPDLKAARYADRRLVAIVLDDFTMATWQQAFANRTAEI